MGGLDLNLSKVTLGTMRFKDKGLTSTDVTRLIECAFDVGVTTHHSSYEYSSYKLYCEALNNSHCKSQIKHICKLANPHFDELKFDVSKLKSKVESELLQLNTDCLDVLQWLLRSQPINDTERLAILEDQNDQMSFLFQQLKSEGKIKSVYSFPYSASFTKAVVKLDHIDGIMSYLNMHETEYSNWASENSFIAIRPFAAGKLLDGSNSISKLISYVIDHENVITCVVGVNNTLQLKPIEELLSKVSKF